MTTDTDFVQTIARLAAAEQQARVRAVREKIRKLRRIYVFGGAGGWVDVGRLGALCLLRRRGHRLHLRVENGVGYLDCCPF